ncbi:MAG: nuclear transport factor 2 family protein [Adhaeribacter sp.]
MKKTFLLVLLLAGLSLVSRAQSKEEKQVAAAVDALRAALLSGDRSQLAAIAAPQLSYGHSTGLIEDKAAFIENLASGTSDFVTMDLTEQTIRVEGDVALVRHKLSAQTNNGGVPGSVKLGVLLVFKKQQGKWLLLARQAFK